MYTFLYHWCLRIRGKQKLILKFISTNDRSGHLMKGSHTKEGNCYLDFFLILELDVYLTAIVKTTVSA